MNEPYVCPRHFAGLPDPACEACQDVKRHAPAPPESRCACEGWRANNCPVHGPDAPPEAALTRGYLCDICGTQEPYGQHAHGVEACRSALRAEVERLTRERDEADKRNNDLALRNELLTDYYEAKMSGSERATLIEAALTELRDHYAAALKNVESWRKAALRGAEQRDAADAERDRLAALIEDAPPEAALTREDYRTTLEDAMHDAASAAHDLHIGGRNNENRDALLAHDAALRAGGERLEDALSSLLCHATDGKLSKTNYEIGVMRQEADWAYQKYTDEAVAEEKARADKAEARVAALEKAIGDAPHGELCDPDEDGTPRFGKCNGCDCWKRAALAREGEEG